MGPIPLEYCLNGRPQAGGFLLSVCRNSVNLSRSLRLFQPNVLDPPFQSTAKLPSTTSIRNWASVSAG